MPINILNHTNTPEGEKGEKFAHLSDNDWELPSQIETLEAWLKENLDNLNSGTYVADLGFSPREGACGGGGVLSVEAMSIMVKLGITLFLSEYPPFEGERN